MKLKKGITVGLCCVATIVSAQEVVTLGTFGFQKVDIPPAGGVNLVGFNFTSDQTLYLEDVFGTNQLTQGFLPSLADNIYVWNGSSYDTYFQKSDGNFYDVANPSTQATTEIVSGMAMFLQSPSGASATNAITLSGSVLMTDSEQQINNNGLLTFSNPYPTPLDLNGTNVDWSEATQGFLPTLADNVYIWNPEKTGGPGYESFFIKTDGKWYESDSPSTLGNAVLPAGGGAFYDAKNTFTNEIIRPFPAD